MINVPFAHSQSKKLYHRRRHTGELCHADKAPGCTRFVSLSCAPPAASPEKEVCAGLMPRRQASTHFFFFGWRGLAMKGKRGKTSKTRTLKSPDHADR